MASVERRTAALLIIARWRSSNESRSKPSSARFRIELSAFSICSRMRLRSAELHAIRLPELDIRRRKMRSLSTAIARALVTNRHGRERRVQFIAQRLRHRRRQVGVNLFAQSGADKQPNAVSTSGGRNAKWRAS